MRKVFLAKTEPSCFSIDDLKKDDVTMWDGVYNYQAINCINTWQIGDYVLIYHSMGQAKIVGVGEVVSDSEVVLNNGRKSCQAKVKFVKKLSDEDSDKLTLKIIKATGKFNDFALVKQSRLSVMECPKEFVGWVKLNCSSLSLII